MSEKLFEIIFLNKNKYSFKSTKESFENLKIKVVNKNLFISKNQLLTEALISISDIVGFVTSILLIGNSFFLKIKLINENYFNVYFKVGVYLKISKNTNKNYIEHFVCIPPLYTYETYELLSERITNIC